MATNTSRRKYTNPAERLRSAITKEMAIGSAKAAGTRLPLRITSTREVVVEP